MRRSRLELNDNQERKTMRALPGKHPDLEYYVRRHKAYCPRPAGLKFRLTDDGPALNGRLCETMPDEEWQKLHAPTEK
jgi:hypothetical protein